MKGGLGWMKNIGIDPRSLFNGNHFSNNHNKILQTGFLGVYWSDHYYTYTLVTNFPEISTFIIGFSFTVWTKKSAKKYRNKWEDAYKICINQ